MTVTSASALTSRPRALTGVAPTLPGNLCPPDAAGLTDGCLADALWYATMLGWPVLPVVLAGHSPAHPGGPSALTGSTNPRQLRRWWATWRGTPAALSAGIAFDVVDVPAAAGRAVLRRWAEPAPRRLRSGPVAVTSGGRMWVFVAAGARAELPGLLDWLDWADVGLDLHVHGLGQELLAPRPPGAAGRLATPRWLIPPAPPNWSSSPAAWSSSPAAWSSTPAAAEHTRPAEPPALPEVGTVLNALAHACHRHQLAVGHQLMG